MFLFTAYKRLMVVCRDIQMWALTRNIPSLCSFTSMFPIVETVSFFHFRSHSGERVAESPNVFPPQSLRNVVFRRGGVYESVFMKSNTARFDPSLRSPSLLQRTLLVCRTVFGSDFVSVTKFSPTLISYSLCVFLLCKKQEVFDHFFVLEIGSLIPL
jgi:hypothetical protein